MLCLEHLLILTGWKISVLANKLLCISVGIFDPSLNVKTPSFVKLSVLSTG